MRIRSHKESGFTLVELMVILTVFGLIVAIAIPTVGSFQRSAGLAGALNTLEADLHQTRALANANRRTYQVLFQGNSYSIVQASPWVTIRTRTMPQQVACAASDTATFYAWGLTEPVVINVQNGCDTLVVRLSGNGRISRD